MLAYTKDVYEENSFETEDIDYYGVTVGFSFGADMDLSFGKKDAEPKLSWTTIGVVFRRGIGDIRTDRFSDESNTIVHSYVTKDKRVNNFSLFIGETVSF